MESSALTSHRVKKSYKKFPWSTWQALSIAITVIVAPDALASAVPHAEQTAPEVPELALDVNPEIITQAETQITLGATKYELAEYEAAIKLWQQAYQMLPFSMRGQLHVPIANAHLKAYEIDRDQQHLSTARAMYTAHLETLAPTDTEGRATIEDNLATIDAKFAEIESERTRCKCDEAAQEAIAREQARHEREQIESAQREEARREALAREDSVRQKNLWATFGSGSPPRLW